MRYESHAYGTREEIVQELRNNLGACMGQALSKQSMRAMDALAHGALAVRVGKICYFVDEPDYHVTDE